MQVLKSLLHLEGKEWVYSGIINDIHFGQTLDIVSLLLELR